MSLFSLEHSAAAYWSDFALYTGMCLLIALSLIFVAPRSTGAVLALWVLAGGAAWSLLEYLLHRFVLHRIAPFSRWHGEHHLRPRALISSPVVLSLTLFVLLAAMPAWWLLGSWPASALTLGLMAGYLAYGLIHHAVHHPLPAWMAQSAWMNRRRTRHAMHHYAHHAGEASRPGRQCHYGVSNSFWDAVFGTNPVIRVVREPQ